MNKFKTKRRFRSGGFTLIELLLVMTIIAVMSSMALGVMRKAQIDAKEAATLARFAQIESILAVELEDFEVRRLPISNRVLAQYAFNNPNHGDGDGDGVPDNLLTQVRNLRRQILMDMLNAEMPRPLVDDSAGTPVFAVNPDVGLFPTNQAGLATGALGFTDWLDNGSNYPNAIGGLRLSELLATFRSAKVQSFQRLRGDVSDSNNPFNLPGEYLYAILERIHIDGTPAVELLGQRAVGDSDSDGFLEVVDAWGDPMQLRIWQVEGQEVDASGAVVAAGGTDIWQDVEAAPNFDNRVIRNFSGTDVEVPFGFTLLDPTQSRELGKIRVEVVSVNMSKIR